MPRPRLSAVDLLRGLVIVLMALDHTRDFVGPDVGLCTDMVRTTPGLFFTRWITHFCAPVFVFLAGMGACLGRRKGTGPLSYYLFTRGLWLMVLELTVIHFFWFLDLTYEFLPLQVIWAIGASMVLLAGCVWLPTWLVGLVGVSIIGGHNALDPITAAMVTARTGSAWLGHLWAILHSFEPIPIGPVKVIPAYGVLAWFGVMAAGYATGTVWTLAPRRRRAWLLGGGFALIALFAVIRGCNGYGDPVPWTQQPTATMTWLSFLNCWKYPPSLSYLLMTLGPALIALALFDREPGRLGRGLIIFGRVPLFFYVVHLPLLQCVGLLASSMPADRDKDMLYGLPATYAVWLFVAVLLYFPCRWFAGVKSRSQARLLSYL